MINEYIFLNSKTFELEKGEGIIVDSNKLAEVISILNKKGYYTELCSKARLSQSLIVSDMLKDLINNKFIEINDNNIDQIKQLISTYGNISTHILFKEKYNFENLLNNCELVNNNLFYNINLLKEGKGIEFKNTKELDNEINRSFEELENWAKNLPNIKN